MTETAKRRRHWRWVILAVVLLLVGGPIALRFRPLNATEKAIVGRWKSSFFVGIHEFHANRRFRHSITDRRGSWAAANGRISFWVDPSPELPVQAWPRRLKSYVRSMLAPPTYAIRFEGPDRFYSDSNEFARVPE